MSAMMVSGLQRGAAGRAVVSTAAALPAIVVLLAFPAPASAQRACHADIDRDGVVGPADLAEVLGASGPCAQCASDLNGDGTVDSSDLGVLLEGWGPCPVGSPNAVPFLTVPIRVDSGDRTGVGAGAEPVYSEVVASTDAAWIRVIFNPSVTALDGPPAGGGATSMRVTSLKDGFHQTLNAQTLGEWGFTSAYFNGDAVRIEIFAADGGSGRVAVCGVLAGLPMEGGVASICGPTDDRCQSSDPRVGRIMPLGCTAWLFDNKQNAMLSAGHCATSFNFSAPEVVQFNVPKSDQSGAPQNPSPSHQYVIDSSSVQFKDAGAGDDWAHFGVFNNSNTGLSPFVAQGKRSFAIATAGLSGLVRVTGFGVDDGWENQTNQTHVGPISGVGPGPVVHYLSDTTGGNSGSPIIRQSDGVAIGVHTNGGCTPGGGSNFGMTLANAELLAAIANPLGVAAAAPPGDLNGDGVVNGQDLAFILGYWGNCSSPCPADLNSDGVVNGADLANQLGSWPPAPNPPSVPAWATLIEAAPDPAVVTSSIHRNAIIATGLAWRVRDNASQIEMLLVPPGTFNMGCSPSNLHGCSIIEKPVHAVSLCPFYIGRYEVTQAQWTARMGSNPSSFSFFADSPNRPVENVSWNTIQGFLLATGLRLPTEAEWEYAYRAGTTTAFHSMPGFPNGTNEDMLVGSIAWFSGNNGPWPEPTYGTKVVGQKAANALGLHDMSGNVWEWVNDWFSGNYYASSPSTNPPGPATGLSRVLRGGSWTDDSRYLRSSRRDNAAPGDPSYLVYGFRVARSP